MPLSTDVLVASLVTITCLLIACLFAYRTHRPAKPPAPQAATLASSAGFVSTKAPDAYPVSTLLWQPNEATGFLPAKMPKRQQKLHDAEDLLVSLPEIILEMRVQTAVRALPELDLHAVLSECATPFEVEMLAERAALVYAFIGYAYLRESPVTSPSERTLPRNLAVPWHAAATVVGRAPTLDYVATVLANDPGPEACAKGCATFSGLADEAYFYQLHVRIEGAAAPAVGAMMRAVDAPSLSARELTNVYEEVARGVGAMADLLPEMSRGCNPNVFHQSIRLSLAGFPELVSFAGVDGAEPRKLGGASGAQSAVLPCVDAFLGIGHSGRHEVDAWSSTGALAHLPPAHRDLLYRLRASGPGSRSAVERLLSTSTNPLSPHAATPEEETKSSPEAHALLEAHQTCIDAVTAFRKAHFTLVRQFILQPAAAMTGRDSPVGIIAPIAGTGGSNLAEFLSGRLLDTTRASLARSFDIFRSPLQRAMA